MKNILAFLGLLILSSSISLHMDKKKINVNKAESNLQYGLTHPLHSFDAKAKDFKCVIAFNEENKTIEAVAVVIQIRDFDSENSNRDSHVIEVLEALKFPSVTFTCNEINYTGNSITANGKLNFHGVSKPFTLIAEQKMENTKLILTGNFNVDMTEFGVDPPGLMGLKTEKDIKLGYKMTFNI